VGLPSPSRLLSLPISPQAIPVRLPSAQITSAQIPPREPPLCTDPPEVTGAMAGIRRVLRVPARPGGKELGDVAHAQGAHLVGDTGARWALPPEERHRVWAGRGVMDVRGGDVSVSVWSALLILNSQCLLKH
jgi:hypothetical protein